MKVFNFFILFILTIVYNVSGQEQAEHLKSFHKSDRVYNEQNKEWKIYSEEYTPTDIIIDKYKVVINSDGIKHTFVFEKKGAQNKLDGADFTMQKCKDTDGNNCLFSLVIVKSSKVNYIEIICGNHSSRYAFEL